MKLRETSSLDTSHLGAPDDDLVVEPSGIYKRIDVALPSVETHDLSYTGVLIRHGKDTTYLLHDTIFGTERRIGVPAHQRKPNACWVA
jgi:hypothetical protein